MKANEMLFWLSARREGSWRQYRAAFEELHAVEDDSYRDGYDVNDADAFPLHLQMRLDFERLAHVEFFAKECDEGWRVAPPTLACHKAANGWRAVLSGARSPALLDRMQSTSDIYCLQKISLPDTPDLILFTSSHEIVLTQLAKQNDLHFQSDAPLAILSQLSPCDRPLDRIRADEFPQGSDWTIDKFDSERLSWRKIEQHEAEHVQSGVLRFRISFQRPMHFLRWKGATYKLPRAVALYAFLQRSKRRLLHYDNTAQTLILPAICRPPMLMERALVLCSGQPPLYDQATARLLYKDVPPDIARFAAELLRQQLLIKTGE